AVDLEQLAGDIEIREVLAEAIQVLPVDGAAETVEQAGPGEQVAAGGERADAAALARLTAQRGDHRRIAQALHRKAGYHEEEVEPAAVVQPGVGQQMHAAGGVNRLAVGGENSPIVERFA